MVLWVCDQVTGQPAVPASVRCKARAAVLSTPGRDLLAWGTVCSGCLPQMRAPPSSGVRCIQGKALTFRLTASVSRWQGYLPRWVDLLYGRHCSYHHLLLLPSSAAIKVRTQFLLVTYVGFRSGLLVALGPSLPRGLNSYWVLSPGNEEQQLLLDCSADSV